ncbi:hypothetical protein LXL04_019760 [Taraxacum kok-saghyz]
MVEIDFKGQLIGSSKRKSSRINFAGSNGDFRGRISKRKWRCGRGVMAIDRGVDEGSNGDRSNGVALFESACPLRGENFFPDILVKLNAWYAQEFGDYLVSEKPHFFVGLIWLELLFAWPLAVASLYGIVAGKAWLRTTCLLYGVTTLTAMVAILSELVGSGKASEKLLMLYSPFMGFAVLAILRGLLPNSPKSNAIGKKPALSRKKRA